MINMDDKLPSSLNFIGSTIMRVYLPAIKSLCAGNIPSNVRNPHLFDDNVIYMFIN